MRQLCSSQEQRSLHTSCLSLFAVEVQESHILEVAAQMEVKKFEPKSGVVIHTSDEEAKQAESGPGDGRGGVGWG